MSKLEFLLKLQNALRWTFTNEEITDILSDYEGFFVTGSEEGKTEHEICLSLGNPSTIARDLAETMEKKKTRPLSARIIKRMVLSIALFVIGLTFCIVVYQSNSVMRDSVFMLIGFCAVLWFALGGSFRGSPPVSRSVSTPRKWLLPGGHILLISMVTACYFFLRDIETKWQSAVDVSSYGSVLVTMLFILCITAILVGILSIYGFYRLSPQFFTISSHAVGVIAYSYMTYSFLMRVNNPSDFNTSLIFILVIYGSSIVLTSLFALFIRTTSRRR